MYVPEDFVELDRSFAPVDDEKELNPEIGRIWGHGLMGWEKWPQLLEHRRVVLLAEAASGKTWEFRNRAAQQRNEGRAAFFVTVEDLADGYLDEALDPADVPLFEEWRSDDTAGDAWFFLDSVDEARLHSKSLDRALKRFNRAVSAVLSRVHVLISCRVSDWRGKDDRMTVERWLPQPKPQAKIQRSQKDADSALLDPIFGGERGTDGTPEDNRGKANQKLVVFQLVPLDAGQRRKLLSISGTADPDRVSSEIEKQGLDTLAGRPGDLLELAGCWRRNGHFGSLSEMVEQAIESKLAEQSGPHSQGTDLTPERARHGAERLAAALTLGKTWTLHAPDLAPELRLSSGSLDPMVILPEWSDPERQALLRRGIFAPATYGRVRFHHRGTQEYLTASWLTRLLGKGCPKEEVWNLLFAERYGVRTLVPSLHAVAAWLAVGRPDFREEILRREPLVLLRYGDPRSLPIDCRERLLLAYAERDLAGDISDDGIDHRSLALLAAPELHDTVRQCWNQNRRVMFRLQLLRLMREGAICGCSDLARGVALDTEVHDYLRITSVEALASCADTVGLSEVARWLVANASRTTCRVAAGFCKALFPRALSVADLLNIIDHAPAAAPETVEGFALVLEDLCRACPPYGRDGLLSGLAELFLDQPFDAPHRRVSQRHVDLVGPTEPFVRETLLDLGTSEPSRGLIRALMALERQGIIHAPTGNQPDLEALVLSHPKVQRELFWADVAETRLNSDGSQNGTLHFWQAQQCWGSLWQLSETDLAWLQEDLARPPTPADRFTALTAIVHIRTNSGSLAAEQDSLRCLLGSQSDLLEYLDRWLTLPPESESLNRLCAEREAQRAACEEAARSAEMRERERWLSLRSRLTADPSLLLVSEHPDDADCSIALLASLTRWLSRSTRKSYIEAAPQWRLIGRVFGEPVAEAYREGLRKIWRMTEPDVPSPDIAGKSGSSGSVVGSA